MVDAIDLAQEPSFSIGRLEVLPAGRELVRDDGARAVLEHRVMQVLIVLAKADGAIVTRDQITERCWHGRIVGEDALNRVISRLRKAADGIGAGSFSIETLTKIGYRLVIPNAAATQPDQAIANPAAPRRSISRRTFGAGLVAAGITSVAGFALLRHRKRRRPAEVEALFAQAWTAWTLGTAESHGQAIGLYRRAIEIDPGSADAWGYLGCLYGDRARNANAAERPALYEQAREAGRRSLVLDRENVLGRMAIAWAQPMRGNWLAMERASRGAMLDDPGETLAAFSLAVLMASVGRMEESAALFAGLHKNPPTATQFLFHIHDLWSIGRRDEAERMLGTAMSIFGGHGAIWTTRFDMLLDAGRYAAAQAFAQDPSRRPDSLTKERISDFVAIADAAARKAPAGTDAIVAKLRRDAEAARWPAARAASYICHLGQVDTALEFANAYLLSRGAVIPDRPVEPGQAASASLGERDTRFLFLPLLRPMRSDPRFGRLMSDLGLARYWRASGGQPDYLRR